MTWLTWILGVALIVEGVLYAYLAHQHGKRMRDQGYIDGYVVGRHDESNWWIRSETQVDRERQKIWESED